MTFTIPYLMPGMNGEDGLIRQHFAAAKKAKDKLVLLFLSQKPRGHKAINTPCRVIYTRYTSSLMDWDNACASFKHIGDSLQKAGILADDSPDVIADFNPVQVKCKRAEQRTEIKIEIL